MSGPMRLRGSTLITYILFNNGFDVGEVMLDENRTKIMTMTVSMMIQAAYQGYHPAPTGSAPNKIATTPMMML